MFDSDSLFEDIKESIALLCDFKKIDERLVELQNEMEVVSELSNKMVQENMRKLQTHEEYVKKYDEILKRYERANVEYDKLKGEKAHKISLSQKLNFFIEELKKMSIAIDHFDDTTFRFMVERVMVSKDKKLTFKFRNGKEIQV